MMKTHRSWDWIWEQLSAHFSHKYCNVYWGRNQFPVTNVRSPIPYKLYSSSSSQTVQFNNRDGKSIYARLMAVTIYNCEVVSFTLNPQTYQYSENGYLIRREIGFTDRLLYIILIDGLKFTASDLSFDNNSFTQEKIALYQFANSTAHTSCPCARPNCNCYVPHITSKTCPGSCGR